MKKIIFSLAVCTLLSTYSCAGKSPRQTDNNETTTEQAGPKKNFTIKTVDKALSGKDAFEKIKAEYKGEVVLIDFWATWCGPCLYAMTEIDRIKPYLIKRGARFVYITGETSPLNDWNEEIKNIEGDHYRLTNKQWNELGNELDMPGIPAYILLNADGSVAFSNVTMGGYPGNEIMQNNIEVALSKK